MTLPKRARLMRDWGDAQQKCMDEGWKCRVCGKRRDDGHRIEVAHTAGREHDKPTRHGSRTLYVHPDDVIPLCGPATDTSSCHGRFDAHRLNVGGHMTPAEQARVVAHLGFGRAEKRLFPVTA